MPQAKNVQSQLLEDGHGEEKIKNKQANSICDIYMYIHNYCTKQVGFSK